MKQKIKLSKIVKDDKRRLEICTTYQCDDCPLNIVLERPNETHYSLCAGMAFPVLNPELLEKEVEIEVSDILTPEEKEYLLDGIRSTKDQIICIKKCFIDPFEIILIFYKIPSSDINVMKRCYFPADTAFQGMITEKCYTLEELGL